MQVHAFCNLGHTSVRFANFVRTGAAETMTGTNYYMLDQKSRGQFNLCQQSNIDKVLTVIVSKPTCVSESHGRLENADSRRAQSFNLSNL